MSVITRMLQDLDARGVAAPVHRPSLAHESSDEVTRAYPWLRPALLSAGVMACAAGLYATTWPESFDKATAAWGISKLSQAKAAVRIQPTHALAASTEPSRAQTSHSDAQETTDWRMDLGLSLGLIKPYSAHPEPRQASKANPAIADVLPVANQATAQSDQIASNESVPLQMDTKTAHVLVIDPPAVGRAQSTASQAAEAYRRAQDLQEQGRDAAALDAAVQALKLDVQHMPARRIAIALAMDQKRLDQAGQLIEEGLKLEPRDSELLFLQARRLVMAGANEQALSVLQGLDRPSAEALGLKAGILAKSGRYAPAALAYEQALKTRPDNATWWLGLGVAWGAQGQVAMAKEAFVRARKLGQLSPDVQAWLDQQI